MQFKHFIKRLRTDTSFKKKIIFGGLWIIVLLGAIITITSDSIFASVLNLNQIAQTRKNNLTAKLQSWLPVSKVSCVDTDWGKIYNTKWTITTIIDWHTRIEEDTCNANGTLREWFCGNPWEAGGLLRSENYVDCNAGYICQNGACVQQPQQIGDAIIENMYITPSNNPTVGTNNIDNQVNAVIKNIGNGPLTLPQQLIMECWFIWWHGWFSTVTIPENIINPGQSITTHLNIGFTDDIYSRYNSLWNRYFDCTLYSQQQQSRTNPTPNNLNMLYESNGNNNSFTFDYTVIDETWSQLPTLDWLGDLIIENIQLLPNNRPLLYSDFSTNTFQITVKNIWNWTILLPMNTTNNLAIQIPLNCYYPNGNWRVGSSVLSTNILWPNQSITTNLDMDFLWWGFFWTLGQQSMMCEIISQQQQSRSDTDLNNQFMIYETNWNNNAFTINYEVIVNK